MSCFNDEKYVVDGGVQDHEEPPSYMNGYLDETELDGDRYMIDFIKSVMAQERNVKADMISILKDQILVLRQELFYKQSVIDTLLRNYDPPCVHGNLTNNQDGHGNTVIRPFSNPITLNNPISYENMNGNLGNGTNKPVITLYSSSSPCTSPYSANMVSNHHHGNKINSPLINPYVSNNPISSLVSKTVEKYEESMQSCHETSVLPSDLPEKLNNHHHHHHHNNTSATDLTQWKYKNTPSRLPISNKTTCQINDSSIPKKDGTKPPLSETLLSVRNLLKSNIPRPQKECSLSPRRDHLQSPKKVIVHSKVDASKSKGVLVGISPTKDVITTHKTFRVKFNKNGWQEK